MGQGLCQGRHRSFSLLLVHGSAEIRLLSARRLWARLGTLSGLAPGSAAYQGVLPLPAICGQMYSMKRACDSCILVKRDARLCACAPTSSSVTAVRSLRLAYSVF